jgi:putative PIN family toxin of toxin-antitoxin system
LKLVVDTNTVISGFLWRQAPRLIIDAAMQGRIQLATSTVLIDELATVIARRKFSRKIAEQGISAGALLERYAKLAELITPAQIRRTVPDDADDDHVLACALAAHADWIVSGDAHLLKSQALPRHAHHRRRRSRALARAVNRSPHNC